MVVKETQNLFPAPKPWWLVFLLGVAAGAGGGLLGVGGGIIMVPILTLWGYSQKTAQGTSLVVIAAIAPVAIFSYFGFGNIVFALAVPLAIGGLIGGEIGSAIALRISNRALSHAFSILLVIVALRMLFLKFSEGGGVDGFTLLKLTEAGILGIFGGLAAGFFGVGGGIVYVPIGVLFMGLTQASAQGSSFAAIFPTALLCAWRYWQSKEISSALVKWLVPGAVGGVILGAFLADVVPAKELRIIFALYLIYTGASRFLRR